MKTTRQLSLTDLKISSLIPPDDPVRVLFEQVDCSFIHPLVTGHYTREGPQGYDPQSLFKALLLIYLGFATSERDLARKLRFDGRLSFLCGFSYGDTPSHSTFHYFRKRLGTETFHKILITLIAQSLCIITKKALTLSIDSSHLEAFPHDADARWGYKTSEFCFYGFKIHLTVTNTELPIPTSVTVTPGNEWDGNFLVELTEQAKDRLTAEAKEIAAVVADAGYDSTDNASYLLSEDITPCIAANPRGRQNPIHRGAITISPDGRLLCGAGVELRFWGREKKRGRMKFRCGLYKDGASQCLFREQCWRGRYGPSFYLKEDYQSQDIVRALRRTERFRRTYKQRGTIERCFSILKGSHALEELRVSGIKEITIHVIMSICAYLCRFIAGSKLKTGLLPV